MHTHTGNVDGFHFKFVEANGITHRLASTWVDYSEARRLGYPLILFLHGFPESWYSWRHQLDFFRGKPFFGVAPDMRGYGSTSQPTLMEDYTLPILAKDVIGIAKYLGYEKFIVVGHDWGASLAWHVALLYPSKVIGVVALSVPFLGVPKRGFLTMLQERYGKALDSRISKKERLKARFHYMIHHSLPKVEEEYDRHAYELLYRIFSNRKDAEIAKGTPEYDPDGYMFHQSKISNKIDLDATVAPGLWYRLPRPTTLPDWLTEKDLDYFHSEFRRAGFSGGLKWYQAMDRNYELVNAALMTHEGVVEDKVAVPSLFLMGTDDNVARLYGGWESIASKMPKFVPQLVSGPIFIQDAGHWIQQECPDIVNEAISKFLSSSVILKKERRDYDEIQIMVARARSRPQQVNFQSRL
jgi:pimeloyl-ACP methyl ester carboxylesterase